MRESGWKSTRLFLVVPPAFTPRRGDRRWWIEDGRWTGVVKGRDNGQINEGAEGRVVFLTVGAANRQPRGENAEATYGLTRCRSSTLRSDPCDVRKTT